MKKNLQKILSRLPFIGKALDTGIAYRENSSFFPGHYCSPIVSVEEIRSREQEIWEGVSQKELPGIKLDINEQVSLLKEFETYYHEMPFEERPKAGLRYYFKNDYYGFCDGIVLYSIMRHFKPKRIIEAGSGFSSALMLDTKDLFFSGNQPELTFIEPFPERLYSLLGEKDKQTTTIIVKDLQAVELKVFEQLDKGDILFIDSTHVSKTGSDVNYILFNIFPVLKSGVIIHVHDIYYPFEYPKEWVLGGRNWNETYLLRSFLMYNDAFKIILFPDYLHHHAKDAFRGLPLCNKKQGASLWIRKR
jgi:hypothetical protein